MRRLPPAAFFLPERVHERERRRQVDESVERARETLVVSHRKCLDGVGSYLIHALAASSPPPVVYTYPGDLVQVLDQVAQHAGENRLLSIADLSMDASDADNVIAALARVKDAGWRIAWRDHHHKQWERIDTARIEALVERFVLDTEAKECGTSLVQKDLLPDDPLAKALADIHRDRDLWFNKDPRSERFEFALRYLGTTAYVDRFLATRDVDAPWIEEAARACRKETDEDIETAVLLTTFHGPGDAVAYVYGEVPKNVTTHTIRERRGTRLEINMKPDGRFSVRSAKGTDVSHLVGQAFGGGGHPNAAGGRLDLQAWEWPFFWFSGGNSPTAKRLIAKAIELVEAAQVAGRDGAGHAGAGDHEAA